MPTKPTPKAAKTGRGPEAPGAPSLGRRLVANMEKLVGAMEQGGTPAVEKKFTVRQVRAATLAPPALGPADVAAIRKSLGVSQAVFAALLGAKPATVRAWEQGVNPPSGVAARFLAEIRSDPGYWKGRVMAATSQPGGCQGR